MGKCRDVKSRWDDSEHPRLRSPIPAGMAIVAETMKNHYLVSSPFLKNQIEKEKMTSLTKLRLKPTKHDLALVKQNYYFVKFDLFVKPSGK
uniref:Uncharacterized protein n=1 Tax=Candidatus Kentrum sp. LFY TaxID=2126342 RepID=A0A450UI45_9GAMM|nr:MAG: hypothetical protein BECKLFY1418A_GA0070994_102133 [Candidatus Kentron sp. LFY]